jgi:hypothetical protein
MKNRSKLTIFTTLLSVLACFGLLSRAQAAEGDIGGGNTVEGFKALNSSTVTGGFNTGLGWFSQGFITTGQFNTAAGAGSLDVNITGTSNTAAGTAALLLNIGKSADNNTAVGTNALLHNSFTATSPATATDNTGVGVFALYNNLDGADNTAVGSFALESNHASDQTAVGSGALEANVNSFENVAVGFHASNALVGGAGGFNGFSVAVGFQALALATNGQNTAVGDNALNGITTGGFNTAIGDLAGDGLRDGNSNNILIGAFVEGHAGENNFTRIADNNTRTAGTSGVFFGGISGATISNTPPNNIVIVNALGQLGTAIASSERFKKDIEPMGKTSETIYSLRPVTFHYKDDTTKLFQCGLIAEEVAKVDPDLITLDNTGKPGSVRHDQINSMLLNEFLKEHKKVEEQQATISELKNEVQTVVAQLKEQAAQIQKVSAQLEVSKPAAQVVTNKP